MKDEQAVSRNMMGIKSKPTQPTLAVFVKLIVNIIQYLVIYTNKYRKNYLVSCDKSHETFCKIFIVFRVVREI